LPNVPDVRLQKYLAHAGVASRRAAEEMIARGRVRVNGKPVTKPGSLVGPGDRVEVDGTPVETVAEPRYLVLHKPPKVMTTMRDPGGRRTVADLVPRQFGRVVPVGRLDFDTSGVLLLTDDGDLAYVLTHPKFGVEKTYRAVVRGRLLPDDVKALVSGIKLEGERARPAKLRVVRTSGLNSEVDVTIHEGKNRQVRRMFEATEHPVVSLVRLRFGPLSLGELPVGHWREATAREVAALRRVGREAQAGLEARAAG
jgi:23S rRNA pseudouridine2605 synthase